jgi:AraC-like DNA-binding protein
MLIPDRLSARKQQYCPMRSTQESLMECRKYHSNSLAEGTQILNREWSRHQVSLSQGEALRLRFSIRAVTPGLSLSNLAYGAPVLVRPGERAEVLLLQMPRAGAGVATYAWGNARLDASHFGLIDVRAVSQLQCNANLDVLVLRISLARVTEWLALTLGERPSRELVFEPQISRGTDTWEAWAPVVAAVDALERSTCTNFPQPAMAALESMVLSTLLLAHPNSYREELLRPRRALAPRHVRLAEQFIHASLDQHLRTEDVARHAGVSVRALFNGFRVFRQTTPAAYIRHVRLAKARENLLRGDDSVSAVAKQCGFGHLGHFAAQYRSEFGELPVETLRLHSLH